MSHKYRPLWNILGVLVLAIVLLPPIEPFHPAPVEAAGISLRAPFNGTFPITSFFDHTYPNLVDDGQIRIYTGEDQPDCNESPRGPYCYAGHNGIDWAMGDGTPVLAAADGTVLQAQWHDGWGYYVILNHGNDYYTRYAHLRNGFNVVVGQQVLAGDLLAWSDNSGSGSKGYHLHFSLYKGGYSDRYQVDPFGWRGNGPDPLRNWGAGNANTSECLWRGLPGDAISCFDHIVEDHNPTDGGGFSHSNDWGYYGCGNGWWCLWAWNENPAISWAKWDSQGGGFNGVIYRGTYRILAWVPQSSCVASKTTQARYIVRYHPYQETTVTVNQSTVNNGWTDLDTFMLEPSIASYRYVYLNDYTGDPVHTKKVAADSIKFSAELTYLPAIASGWTTYVDIANLSLSNSTAHVTINWYNRNGSPWTAQDLSAIPANGRATQSVSNFSGSAVVVSDQDVAVTVRRERSDRVTAYTGVSEAARGSGWGEPGVTVYIPVVVWNAFGSWKSTLYVQNTTAATANFTINYCKQDGTNCQDERTVATPTQLNPFGSQAYTAEEEEGNNYYGYAKITSDQPLAVVVAQEHDTIGASDYNAFAAGASTIYLPSLMSTWDVPSPPASSSFTVQNLGTSATNVQIRYVEDNGDVTEPALLPLAAGASYIVTQHGGDYSVHDDWHGSARLTSSNGQPLAAVVNQEQTNTHQSYSSFNRGGSTIYGPFTGRAYAPGNGYTYDSSSEVMNLGTTQTSATRYYYNPDGSLNKGTGAQAIDPERVFNFYVPSEQVTPVYGGAVKITRNNSNPFAAIHNFVRNPLTYDYGASYNMPWRY